jgi:predicted Zn-dependent protease
MRLALALVLGCAAGCVSLPDTLPATLEEPVDDDPLTLAADCLARGDDSAAARHFERYVRAHPDQLAFRVHLADLYLKLGRDPEAKCHFERFAVEAPDAAAGVQSHLVHCHTKLMEIAQRTDDRFGERMNRGVGLLVLVRQGIDDDATREEILCQAIAALREAKEERPKDARVHQHLAEAHERAGHRREAEVARAAAKHLALPGDLPARAFFTLAP